MGIHLIYTFMARVKDRSKPYFEL